MKPASAAGSVRLCKRLMKALWQGLLLFFLCSLLAPLQAQTIDQLELSPGLVAPSSTAQAPWHTVALPHAWYRQGWCDVTESTYRFAWDWIDTGDQRGAGLLIHRAGNRVRVWLNQTPVAQFGDLQDSNADYSNFPLLVQLPRDLLQTGRNTVHIQIAGDCRRLSGLSRIEIGPFTPIAAQHKRATDWLLYPIIVVVTLCSLLVVAALVYHRLTPSKQALGFAAINAVWSCGTLLWLMREPPIPYALWYVCVDMSYAVWVLFSARLTMQLTDTLAPWVVRLQLWTFIVYLIANICAGIGVAIPLKQITMVWALLVYTFLIARVFFHTVREPTETRTIICFTIAPMFLVGAADSWSIWLSQDPLGYQTYFFSPIASFMMLLSLGLLMMRQFQQAMRNDKHYQHSLEQEVQRQRLELAVHYRHEQAEAQKAAVQAERQRIVRDMHDGLGSQLVGMLAAVRSDGIDPNHLENEIAQAMEHLRATMDNLSSTEEDLSTVLAQFRFHHEPRLLRAGLHLRWRVKTLPATPWPPSAIWEMQQILREAFANILKHAQAREITVTASCQDGVCSIHIRDDGQGFDLDQQRQGRGLRHLQERAHHLGLQVRISSAPGQGTRVELEWAENFVPATMPPSAAG